MKHAMLGLLLVPCVVLSVSAQSNWTMGDYDAMRTSWVQYEAQFAPPLTATTYDYPEPLASAEGFKTYNIGYANGIAYLGIGAGPFGNAIAAYDYKTSTILWTTPIEGGAGAVGNDPIITENRIISGGQRNAVLTGMDRQTGAVLWTRDVESMYTISATLHDGRIYVCTDSVYCLDPETGSQYWIMPSTRTQGGTPAVTGNSLVHVSDGRIVVRNTETGEIRWSRPGASREGLTIDENRLFVAGDSSVLAMSIADGTILWKHEVPEQINIGWLAWNGLARTNTILIYAISEDNDGKGTVRALDIDDGTVLWTYKAPGLGILSLTIINGYVYFGEWHSRELVALDITDGSEAARISGSLVYTKAIFGDRKLYAAYTNDPLIGGGLAVYTSAAVATDEVPAPAYAGLEIYPNPASSWAGATYTLPAAARVELRVFDALGRQVAAQSLGQREAGLHEIQLGGMLPASLPAGVYRVLFTAGTNSISRNLIIRR